MDSSGRRPVTPDCNASENDGAPDSDNDSPGWPLGGPTCEALDYLEQALTTGIPKPTYDGPIRRVVKHDGRYPVDVVLTLPLETPLHTAQSASAQDHLMWEWVGLSPEPDRKTCSPSELTKIPTNDTRDAQASAPQAPSGLEETTNAQSPPRGTFSRPKLRGILRKGSPSRTQEGSTEPAAQAKAATDGARRVKTGGTRRTVEFQMPQGEAESDPPEKTRSRPRLMVTIKSHAAARKWQELEQKKR
ncbi:hypothetical protein INS49_004951 [Diaporthe citri]|uniref:uncharacterized protein n=1 Tax=Diaporthe citri TaxID=83186 RepID=UPI001C8153E4|nr:uncharacterized protein INS49_004951 [Diaporthe citri]KAG6353980.1 hypothetical protein INS49_004951 [Diaporthe citri]